MFTPSPNMSSLSAMTSPRLMPMRNSIRFSDGLPSLRSAMPRCTSTAQRTASTTLANSARNPSPVFLTVHPWCSTILGSIRSRRWAWRLSCVPSSSAPISREYPATSAARIATRRRTAGVVHPAKGALNQTTLNPAAAIARPMTDCGSPRISGFTNRLEAIGFSEADFRGGCKTSVEGSVA